MRFTNSLREGVTLALAVQLNIGEFGDVQKSDALSTRYTKSRDPKNGFFFAENTQKFARTGIHFAYCHLVEGRQQVVLGRTIAEIFAPI